MNKIAIAVSDFDSHICKLGQERCAVCKTKAQFYRVSNEKWARLQAKWELVRQRMDQPYQPDAMVVAAILTPPDYKEEVCKP